MRQFVFERILFLLLPVFALARDGAVSKPITHIVQNISDLGIALESLPKECKVNGKVYKEGEEYVVGNLRYRCQKYGIHSAEGCITEHKEELAIGQVLVKDNVKSLCLAVGGKIFYKEASCSVPGSPDCKDVGPPKEYEDACKAALSSAQHQLKQVSVPGLPPGWKVIDEAQQAIPGMENRVLSRTIMFIPFPTKRRVRRQEDKLSTSTHGIKGYNPSMNMNLSGGKLTNALGGLVNSKSTRQAVGGLTKIAQNALGELGSPSSQKAIGGLANTAQKTVGALGGPSTQQAIGGLTKTTQNALGELGSPSSQKAIGGLTKAAQKTVGALGGPSSQKAIGGLTKTAQNALGELGSPSSQKAIGGLTKTAQKALGGLGSPKSLVRTLFNTKNTKRPTQQRPRNKHRRIGNRRKGHNGNRNFGNSRRPNFGNSRRPNFGNNRRPNFGNNRRPTNRPQRKPDILRASLPHGQQQDFTFSVNGRSLSRIPGSMTIASSPTGFTVREGD